MKGCSNDSVPLSRAQKLVYLVDVRNLKNANSIYKNKKYVCVVHTDFLYWLGKQISLVIFSFNNNFKRSMRFYCRSHLLISFVKEQIRFPRAQICRVRKRQRAVLENMASRCRFQVGRAHVYLLPGRSSDLTATL